MAGGYLNNERCYWFCFSWFVLYIYLKHKNLQKAFWAYWDHHSWLFWLFWPNSWHYEPLSILIHILIFSIFLITSTKTTNENMFFVYRKISKIFPGSNHDQHDFAKKPTQIYDAMVNVLKQLKNTKRVNETLENEFNERENHNKKKFLPQLLPPLNEHLNFLIPKYIKKLVKSLNRSSMFFVLNFEPIMTGILQKTWNSIILSFIWKTLLEYKFYPKWTKTTFWNSI